eukprot:11068112-Heterocapsa_arctica.AAC.1
MTCAFALRVVTEALEGRPTMHLCMRAAASLLRTMSAAMHARWEVIPYLRSRGRPCRAGLKRIASSAGAWREIRALNSRVKFMSPSFILVGLLSGSWSRSERC